VGDTPLAILVEDEFLLAVDKPSGMLVHSGWARDGVLLVDLVREYLGPGTVHPLHRLDRGTSGVVLFARTAAIAAAVQAGFGDGRVEKRYLALVRGVAPESGDIDHPVPRRPKGPRVPAQTGFRRLAWVEAEPREVSLVEAFPRTGRLHQVRRHLRHLNHPVIGDANYGACKLNRALAAEYGLRRLALHAARLHFTHPITGQPMTIEAPLPADFREPLQRMGFDLC